MILRGGIQNRDPRYIQKSVYLPTFINNIWSYLLWPPVISILYLILLLRWSIVNRTYRILQKPIYTFAYFYLYTMFGLIYY